MPDLKAIYPYIKHGINKLNDNSRKWPLLIFSPMRNPTGFGQLLNTPPMVNLIDKNVATVKENETKIAFIMMNLLM